MSSRILRSLRFIPRHKKKIVIFGLMPGIVYKTYMNSQLRIHSEDMGQFETSNQYKL